MTSFKIPEFTAVPPKWYTYGLKDEDLEKLTADDWKRIEAEVVEYNKVVSVHNAIVHSLHVKLIQAAEELYEEGPSDVAKYIRSHAPQRKAEISLSTLTHKQNVFKQNALARDRERKAQELLVKAVVFLTQHGKSPGTDYDPAQAVDAANDIRREELIKEKLEAFPDELFEFCGSDNCEDCGGWDGEDRRCSCGNRRVYWESEGDFTNMYIYGMAW